MLAHNHGDAPEIPQKCMRHERFEMVAALCRAEALMPRDPDASFVMAGSTRYLHPACAAENGRGAEVMQAVLRNSKGMSEDDIIELEPELTGGEAKSA